MSQLPVFARALRCVFAVFAITALLGGCGSSSRVEDYVPTRVMSFGDELSLIKGDGSKYTINGFTSGTTTPDCTLSPVWNQALATNFGLAFPACKPATIAIANGSMNAAQGATVDAVALQINAVAPSEFVPSTLVTIQGGMWDIINAYTAHKGSLDSSAALAQVRAAGKRLAGLVNQVTNNGAGARVIYANVPDLGFSPLAITEQAASACAVDCVQLLKNLSFAFNEEFRINVTNDGRYAAVVAFDDMVRSMANVTVRTTVYGLNNTDAATSVAACTVADISLCTTSTLVAELAGSASGYLWASDRLPGPNWHARVAGVAITRARNNPF
jgi:outer membrane lipase/esterase